MKAIDLYKSCLWVSVNSLSTSAEKIINSPFKSVYAVRSQMSGPSRTGNAALSDGLKGFEGLLFNMSLS